MNAIITETKIVIRTITLQVENVVNGGAIQAHDFDLPDAEFVF